MLLKEYEPEQHALYDDAAKRLGIQFWEKIGYSCHENPDPYGIDLIVEGKDRSFYCEVEIRLAWKGPSFPFPTLMLPLRKKKFARDRCMFMVINRGQTHAMMVHAKDVLASPTVENANERVSEGERFFDIPLEATQLIPLLAKVV